MRDIGTWLRKMVYLLGYLKVFMMIAWWAAIYVVTQIRTQLKWLSNSSSSSMIIELRCLISSAYYFQFCCILLFSQAQSELFYTRYVISNTVIFYVFLKLPTFLKKVFHSLNLDIMISWGQLIVVIRNIFL